MLHNVLRIVLQRVAACCSVLQCHKALVSIATLTALKILDIAGRFGECVLQCVVRCVAQCVEHCVAACCSVLQCVVSVVQCHKALASIAALTDECVLQCVVQCVAACCSLL